MSPTEGSAISGRTQELHPNPLASDHPDPVVEGGANGRDKVNQHKRKGKHTEYVSMLMTW